MERVVLDGFGCDLVERLHVDQAADETFLVHLHHVGGNSAEGEACMDSTFEHFLADILDDCERRTARTGLDGESFLEITAVDNHFRRIHGEQDVTRVLGITDGA